MCTAKHPLKVNSYISPRTQLAMAPLKFTSISNTPKSFLIPFTNPLLFLMQSPYPSLTFWHMDQFEFLEFYVSEIIQYVPF